MERPDLTKPAFRIFPDAAENIKNDLCAWCAKPMSPDEFRDALSRKEFSISGMCQKCQDKTFGEREEREPC